ncbi:MAG: phosphoribosylanthranilate isomerase [Pseudobutyrivibrio sp.]|nr:phosphoribosylanthranilate isomerase [Pseudobutyrivibrio sp.]
MKIKICGLTSPVEATYLNNKPVDYAGMVLFFEKSKRNISLDRAKEIMAVLDSRIKRVAVVVSPDVDQMRLICNSGFDIVQVHGGLSAEVIDACTINIWKAFNVSDMDTQSIFADQEKITGFVFDGARPGSGQSFCYDLLESIDRDSKRLFILAGGLNPDNVAQAIEQVKPDVVDVSSGVEYKDRPGKNPSLVDEFVSVCN